MTRGVIAGATSMIAVVSMATGASAAEPAAKTQATVQAALDASAAAWNAADLDRFMTCYENAPTTTYVSGAHFVHGYDAIRAMYAERFGGGTSAAMGQL